MIKDKLRAATRSLRARSFYENLIGLALGVVVFFILTRLGAAYIDNSYLSPENVSRRKAQIYTQFSNYITAEGVSGRDAAAVARWTASHSDVTIFLFGSGREQQLYAGGRINEDGRASYDPTLHGKLYPVRFADGLRWRSYWVSAATGEILNPDTWRPAPVEQTPVQQPVTPSVPAPDPSDYIPNHHNIPDFFDFIDDLI